MIRQYERESSVLMECTNCTTTWVVRYATEKRLEETSRRHFATCMAPEPRKNPKIPKMYNLPRHPSPFYGQKES